MEAPPCPQEAGWQWAPQGSAGCVSGRPGAPAMGCRWSPAWLLPADARLCHRDHQQPEPFLLRQRCAGPDLPLVCHQARRPGCPGAAPRGTHRPLETPPSTPEDSPSRPPPDPALHSRGQPITPPQTPPSIPDDSPSGPLEACSSAATLSLTGVPDPSSPSCVQEPGLQLPPRGSQDRLQPFPSKLIFAEQPHHPGA